MEVMGLEISESAVGTRCANHVTPLYPQKLALTSPTGGGRSVGMVRSRTKATEFSFSLVSYKVTLCIWWYAYSCLCNRSTNPMHQPFLGYCDITLIILNKFAQLVTLLTCIWEVSGLHLVWDTNYCYWYFSLFPSACLGKFCVTALNWAIAASFHTL